MSPQEKAMYMKQLKEVHSRAIKGHQTHEDYRTVTKVLLKLLGEVKVTE